MKQKLTVSVILLVCLVTTLYFIDEPNKPTAISNVFMEDQQIDNPGFSVQKIATRENTQGVMTERRLEQESVSEGLKAKVDQLEQRIKDENIIEQLNGNSISVETRNEYYELLRTIDHLRAQYVREELDKLEREIAQESRR